MWLARIRFVIHMVARKHALTQRLKNIQRQLHRAQNAVQSFERKILSKNSHRVNCSLEMRSLSSVVHIFIEGDQQKLRDQFEYDKQMLIFDANDHYLVRDFYRLKPSISQVNEKACIFIIILFSSFYIKIIINSA